MAQNIDTTGKDLGCIFYLIQVALLFGMCYGCYRWLQPTDYVSEIEEALNKREFSKANRLLRDMKDDSRYLDVWGNSDGYNVYLTTFNKVIQAEISYLVNEGDQQASDRLIAMINEYPINSSPAIGTTHDSDIIEANDKYNAEVGKFNDYCNQILSRAISTKNQYLAEAIVNTFKPTLERKKVDTHFFGNDEYDYQYVDSEKEKAKSILKEAIREKKFSN